MATPLVLETLWWHSDVLSDSVGVLEWCRGVEQAGQEIEGLCQKRFWLDGRERGTPQYSFIPGV